MVPDFYGDSPYFGFLLVLFFLIAFPVLGTMGICAVVAGLLRGLRWWRGALLGLPVGVANIVLGFMVALKITRYVPFENDFLEVMLPYVATMLVTSSIPGLGMVAWNFWRRRHVAVEQTTP